MRGTFARPCETIRESRRTYRMVHKVYCSCKEVGRGWYTTQPPNRRLCTRMLEEMSSNLLHSTNQSGH